jgi:hypothetical protein
VLYADHFLLKGAGFIVSHREPPISYFDRIVVNKRSYRLKMDQILLDQICVNLP